MCTYDFVLGGIMGLVVGDALGVPTEFQSREELSDDPVTNMRQYGTHYQPAGTWSDDSSMVLASMDSLSKKLNYIDMMDKFSSWLLYGEYTPYGEVFDIGVSTSNAIMNYTSGMTPLECGGKSTGDNGNGSLMRILPTALYFYGIADNLHEYGNYEMMQKIHEISSLTHAHPRSQVGCGLYAGFIGNILRYRNQYQPLALMKECAQAVFGYYARHQYLDEMIDELEEYSRLRDIDTFAKLSEYEIKSSGYVVDTLEAAIWCFITTDSYEECVLRSVNLGDDTDTVAAVAGGLAGCYYGYSKIPDELLKVIAKREWIEGLCRKFQESLIEK
ncbi:MAG: ADP-ribosylglycohydrolase family protein [Mobilitalea sp.]